MQGKQPKAEQAAAPKGKPKAEAPKRRRLTKAEYGALSDKHKAQYDSQFPKSGHTIRFKKSKKPKTNLAINGKESRKDAAARRKAEGLEVDAQRNTMHVEGAGVINKESVKALALITPQHLQQAATNIDNNRAEVHELVTQAFADKPKLLERGLASVRDMMQGGLLDDDVIDGEFEEIDEDSQATEVDGTPLHDEAGNAVTRKQAKESQTQGQDGLWRNKKGETAAYDDGRPITKAHMDDFDRNKGEFKKRRGDDKPYLDENGDKQYFDDGDEMTIGDRRELDYEDIRKARAGGRAKGANRAHKDSKKQRDGMSVTRTILKYSLLAAGIGLMAVAAGPLTAVIARGLLEYWSDMRSLSSADMDEQNTNTVDELITQTVSYLRNMDHDDLQSQSKDMFTAIAASPNVDVYNIAFSAVLPWVSERPKGRPGKNFFGGTHSTRKQIAEAIAKALDAAKVLHEHEQYRSDGDECDLFYCKDRNRTLIALGSHDLLGIYHVAFLNW